MGKGELSRGLLWVISIGCAASVANLYYVQPLLTQVQSTFHATTGQAGLVATLCQVGYALGMLLVVPLGDVLERRRLIVSMVGLSVLALFFMAAAPTLGALYLAAFLVGFTTCTPQILVPLTAHLATPELRGRAVGLVMGGLLIGILLARTVSGFIGAAYGWRAMFAVAGVLMIVMAGVLQWMLPPVPPTAEHDGYGKLLKSLWVLVREEPVLREASVFGACGFGAFSAFWTTLGFLLAAPPYHLGPRAVGLFGLVGVAGALAAPLVGRRGDRGHARQTAAICLLILLASFVLMYVGAASILALIIGTLMLDIGTQGTHVSNQTRVFALRPEARSRLNTVYMTTYFVGGSLGSALAAWAWGVAGWLGVSGVGLGFCVVALTVHAVNTGRFAPVVATAGDAPIGH